MTPASTGSTESDDTVIAISDIIPSIISHSSRETSPTLNGNEDELYSSIKKKKKKKPKKSAKAKEAAAAAAVMAAKTKNPEANDANGRPPILCISRNKHWRHISSYHGPWLQLPLELLESLLVLNLDPATLSAAETRLPPPPSTPVANTLAKSRDRGFPGIGNHSLPDSYDTITPCSLPPTFPIPKPGKATPPPIDPGVFRCVTSIRKLIDEAAELSVRASSGLSAAALGSMRGGGSSGINNSPWATAHVLGLNPLGDGGGGRNFAMSAMRVHRLRALAVQKLAQAYKADEIASSVMVMQGGSVFEDVAERVLKIDPNDVDAKYVHFFHEKIPSRQLAESTTTQVLNELIAAEPQRLEFYRTRGIVHCFRDEFPQATKDFTYALKEARAIRKAKLAQAKLAHRNDGSQNDSRSKNCKKKKGSPKSNGQAPPSGTSAATENTTEGTDGEPLLLHPSVLPDAPDPIEPQLLFFRGSAYLQQAVFLIENAILNLEGIRKAPSIDGAELRLCYIENGRYGGVEIGHPDGPLGKKEGVKVMAYRQVLGKESFREQITNLVRKSIRDHEKFLSHFDTLEGPSPGYEDDLAHKTEYAFLLSESIRPGNHSNAPPINDIPLMFTTYHPLLVESYFSILICQLMLADFSSILPTFVRTASVIEGLEGYPVFLPPRSMAQAEFIEVLERLAGGWRNGIQSHSLLHPPNAKARLAIEAPPWPSPPMLPTNGHGHDPHAPSSSRAPTGQGSGSGASGPPPFSGRESPAAHADLVEALDCARILLAPVLARQRDKAGKVAASKNKKKPMAIHIPLHGPRVEVILAWLGAVHLVELDAVA